MKDFKKNLLDGLSKTSKFLKDSSEEAVNKIKEGAEKLSTAGPVAKEKVIEVVNDVLAVLPILEQVGYRTNEFKIGMSITPVIEISFSRFLNVSEEEVEKIKKEQEDRTMFNMILSMLETANSISGKLETDDFDVM
jgi:hypothetical protein